MKPVIFFLLFYGQMLLLHKSLNAQNSAKRSRPNIVFIISDDHRWDALGAAGNSRIKTPTLDKLAREGVYFKQATIHVSQCAPSRASLLTGLSPHKNGYYCNNFVRADMQWANRFSVPTLPELLEGAGYQTILAGKWHLATDPWLSGFSDIRTWLPEAGSDYKDARLATGNSRKKEQVKGFTNGVFANDAIEFLNSPASKEKPFLLWLAATIPHAPFQPNPSEFEEMYESHPAGQLIPPAFPKNTEVKLELEGTRDGSAESSMSSYYSAISYLDDLVGQVLSALKKQGLAENTIVIFLGDNGYMAGSHGVRGKVVPWEESVRVPMIIYAPGISKLKGSVNVPASSLDIPVTILSMAGVSCPENWSGRDLSAVLSGKKNHGIDYAISEWADTESQFRNYTHRLIRTSRYKLIRWDKADKPDELYDFVEDPQETTNIIHKPSMKATRDKMLAQLNAMIKTDDSARFWPAKNGGMQYLANEARREAELRVGLDDKTPAKVDPAIFDSYAGRYEFVTRVSFSISRDGNGIFLTGEGGQKSALIPKSETEFLHKNLPVRFTFIKDEKGKITHVVRRSRMSDDQRTIDMKARRL
jgi:N-acetylglucosamine-6-sulfatase